VLSINLILKIPLKNQTAQDKKEDKNDDNSDDNIRAPIPAVKGVMLAQSYRQTYGLFFKMKKS